MGVQVTCFVCPLLHLSSCSLFLSRSRQAAHCTSKTLQQFCEPDSNGVGWAIVRCQFQVRSGRWTGHGRNPAPSRYIHRNTKIRGIYTNFRNVPYPVFGVCTLAVQRSCIPKVCRRLRVRIWFAPFLNSDLDWYMPVYTSTYQYIPVYTSTYQNIPVCTGMCWYMLVYTGIC